MDMQYSKLIHIALWRNQQQVWLHKGNRNKNDINVSIHHIDQDYQLWIIIFTIAGITTKSRRSCFTQVKLLFGEDGTYEPIWNNNLPDNQYQY